MSDPKRARAALAVSASTTVWPSCDRRSDSVQRISDSSSTTRIVQRACAPLWLRRRRRPRGRCRPSLVMSNGLRERREGAGADGLREQLRRAMRGHHDDAARRAPAARTRRSSARSSESGSCERRAATTTAAGHAASDARASRAEPASMHVRSPRSPALRAPPSGSAVRRRQPEWCCHSEEFPTRKRNNPRRRGGCGRRLLQASID